MHHVFDVNIAPIPPPPWFRRYDDASAIELEISVRGIVLCTCDYHIDPSHNKPSKMERSISWSTTFPGSTSWSKKEWGTEPKDYHSLSLKKKAGIERSTASLKVHIAQMIKIRATVLLDKCPWKFHGYEEISKLKSTHFEEVIGRHLTSWGLKFLTEDQQVREYGQGTPDFLLEEPCRINGVLCHWIEVKGMYGCGFFNDMKSWNPSRKCFAQVQRYTDQFGSGALIMKYGFGERFRAHICNGELLLDASLLLDQPIMHEHSSLKPCSKRAKCSPNACPCGFIRHPHPPAHFNSEDKRYCCKYCRLSNGKRHGGHCTGTMA